MAMPRRLLLALSGVLILHSGAFAQPTIHWQTSLDGAKRMAAQSNRLVLVVFSAPWCTACRAMEAEVLSQPAVIAALDAHYVPVHLNADYYRGTAGQYGVSHLPTTIILKPGDRDEVLEVIRGKIDAGQFTARLNQVAEAARQRTAAVYANMTPGSAGRPAAGPPPELNLPPAGPPPTFNPAIAGPPPVLNASLPGPPGMNAAFAGPPPGVAGGPPGARPGPAAPSASLAMAVEARPVAPAVPPIAPLPVGLEGYCPVQLVDKGLWTLGDKRWGAMHRGQTFLFAGQEEQQRFLATPDHYAPVNFGNDVVMALEQGRSVAGVREHGVTFAGRVYLFAEEGSLERFSKNPRYYADRATEATNRGAWPDPQRR
jgi:YHS domain-containing protein/thiol-disulfide isomerase/thioredoxin